MTYLKVKTFHDFLNLFHDS